VIYLTDRAREVVARLCREAPAGSLVRNSERNAWTKDAINCAFFRLRLALGRRAMEELRIGATVPTRFRDAGVASERLAEARSKHTAPVRAAKENTRLARENG
jgi:hypothetical protein